MSVAPAKRHLSLKLLRTIYPQLKVTDTYWKSMLYQLFICWWWWLILCIYSLPCPASKKSIPGERLESLKDNTNKYDQCQKLWSALIFLASKQKIFRDIWHSNKIYIRIFGFYSRTETGRRLQSIHVIAIIITGHCNSQSTMN